MPKRTITEDEFKIKMIEKYGNFDFSTLSFKLSKTTLKCNKCGSVNTKTALRHISCTCSNCYSNLSQRSNNEDFISKTEGKFGVGKYNFDKLNYINAVTKITLYCVQHQDYFDIIPNKFLCSKGCNVCNRNDAYSTEQFIEKCESNYPGLFDYTSTEYVNQKTKVIVKCKTGDHDWIVSPKTLIKGVTKCGECSGKGGRNTEKFIKEAQNVHNGKYSYENVEYVHSNQRVEIICEAHGIFTQTPKAHLTGRGCPSCGEYGYQPNHPGIFYLQKLTSDDKTVYKFGISGNVERRITEQMRNSVFEHELLKTINFEQGIDALNLENIIKSTIPTGIVTKDELKSGFSETFSEEYLEIVLKLIEDSM